MIVLFDPLLMTVSLPVLRLLIAPLEYLLLMTVMEGRLLLVIVALRLRKIATCDVLHLNPYKMFRRVWVLPTEVRYEDLYLPRMIVLRDP